MATPALAAIDVPPVQVRLAPEGPVAMATLMVSVAVVGLPPLSSTVTAGWMDQAAPFGPPPGWVVKASSSPDRRLGGVPA